MPRSRLFWALLSGLGIALAILILRHDKGTVAGLDASVFASLTVQIALVVFLGGLLIAMFRHRLAEALGAALIWIVIALVLTAGYAYRGELRQVADRIIAELIPGHVAVRGMTMEVARGRNGNFQVAAHVNGARILMVLDTGASSVVLTQDAAKAAGLPLEVLSYSVPIETANGRTYAAAVTLDRVAVGSIIERAVPALIAQPGQLRVSLLGMSFLDRLESWEVRGDRLLMRGKR